MYKHQHSSIIVALLAGWITWAAPTHCVKAQPAETRASAEIDKADATEALDAQPAEAAAADGPAEEVAQDAGAAEPWWQPLQDGGNRAKEAMRGTLGPPLKSLHRHVDQWLASLPMTVAMASALGLYLIALIWTWTLSKNFVFRGAPDHHRWRDLRIWASLVMLPYVVLYCWLGR